MSAVLSNDDPQPQGIEGAADLSRMEPWQWEVLERVVYYSQRGTEIALAVGRTPQTIYKTMAMPVFKEELYAEIQRKNMRDSQTRLHKLETRAIEILEETITYGEIAMPKRDDKGNIIEGKLHRERVSGRAILKTVNDILTGTGQMGTNARPVTAKQIESGMPTGLGALIIATHAAGKEQVQIEASPSEIIGDPPEPIIVDPDEPSPLPEEPELISQIADDPEETEIHES